MFHTSLVNENLEKSTIKKTTFKGILWVYDDRSTDKGVKMVNIAATVCCMHFAFFMMIRCISRVISFLIVPALINCKLVDL